MNLRKLARFGANGASLYPLYRTFMKSQFRSREELAELQRTKLRRIAWTAVHHVPYYAHLKSQIDFGNFTLSQLKKFPIVDKKLIRSRYEDFLVRGTDQTRLQYKQTSGSSGAPFRVPKFYLSDAVEGAIQFRAFSLGRDYTYRPRDPLIVLRSYAPKPGESPVKHDRFRNYWYLSCYHINEENLSLYLRVIESSGAKILKGYPSSLFILTTLLKAQGIPRPKGIRTLVTSSENFLPQYRKAIESYWSIPVLDWYGQNERTVTAQQCPCGHYLNNDEYGILEVDGENQIIGTNLNNDIMPLIRYATGDIAVPSEKLGNGCSGCGRGLSVAFQAIQGRSDDILMKADGTPVPSVNIYTAMEEFRKVKQFRVVQDRSKGLDLFLSEVEKLAEGELEMIKASLRERLGEVAIRIEIVPEITRDARTDKIRIIESHAAKEWMS